MEKVGQAKMGPFYLYTTYKDIEFKSVIFNFGFLAT